MAFTKIKIKSKIKISDIISEKSRQSYLKHTCLPAACEQIQVAQSLSVIDTSHMQNSFPHFEYPPARITHHTHIHTIIWWRSVNDVVAAVILPVDRVGRQRTRSCSSFTSAPASINSLILPHVVIFHYTNTHTQIRSNWLNLPQV